MHLTRTKMNCSFKVIFFYHDRKPVITNNRPKQCPVTSSLAHQVPYYQIYSPETGNNTILCHSASILSILSKVSPNLEALVQPSSWLPSCEKSHYTDKLGQNVGAPVAMPG